MKPVCPSCGGILSDGHDDGRDLVDVACKDCGEEWTSTPDGWLPAGSAEAAESWERSGRKIRIAMAAP